MSLSENDNRHFAIAVLSILGVENGVILWLVSHEGIIENIPNIRVKLRMSGLLDPRKTETIQMIRQELSSNLWMGEILELDEESTILNIKLTASTHSLKKLIARFGITIFVMKSFVSMM